MSNEQLTGEARRRRIDEIRAEKGYLLGRGVVLNATHPGCVPAVPEVDPMRDSVLVYQDGVPTYVYKGAPKSSIRQPEHDFSEYGQASFEAQNTIAPPQQAQDTV
jgi:hypothetical protein